VLRWHRQLVRTPLDQAHCPPGRTSTSLELRRPILRMAAENPTWGDRRIHGGLTRLGHTIAPSTVWLLLSRAGVDPAPRRAGLSWPQFVSRPGQRNPGVRLLHADTVLLTRLYVLGRAVGVTDRYGRTLLAEFRLQDTAAGNGRPGRADGQPR
jgi:putative transposase